MKRITKRMLAVLLTLVMVIGFVPGNLSVLASAEGNTIYVAPNGNDETGDGTLAKPYASIQKAVNTVPQNNEVPTTILVAEGAYNVYVASDSSLLVTGTYGHNLLIDKDNVTIKAAEGAEVILYSYTSEAFSTGIHYLVPTVRALKAKNVTLDGLTVLPAMRGATGTGFTVAVTVADLPAKVDAAIDVTTAYIHDNPSTGGVGVITSSTNVNYAAGDNFTVQNCTVGYEAATTYAFYIRGMTDDYHLKNNTVKGIMYIRNEVVGEAGEITGNDFYTSGIDLLSTGVLPVIRDNTLHDKNGLKYSGTPVLVRITKAYGTYTDGALSVICLTSSYTEGTRYPAYTSDSTYDYVFFSVHPQDTTMDTEEELCYYLGQEGDVTLTRNFTITKDIMPAKILANLDMGAYTITTSDNTFAAPAGYFWNASSQLEKENWIASALLLQNDLNMKFYVAEDLVANGEYLMIDGVKYDNWKDGTGDNVGKKYVTFSGIMATEMMETVSVQLYEANGDAVEECIHTDSVRLYANRLKDAYGDNTVIMNLITAVLNYGAAAQTFAGESDATKLANYNW